ncbi:uncharacterized protein KZ484_004777 [Pholidichthys leucotaenia]
MKLQTKMGSYFSAEQEKCYNPSDSTLTFVDREDELDLLCEGFRSQRALMSCGHAVTPISLTKWCLRLLDQGESRFVCAQLDCGVEWPFTEVCKMALLTPKEKEHFKNTMASNAKREHLDIKMCPQCRSSVVKEDKSNLNVCCEVCTVTRGRAYEFCWHCLREWKGAKPRSDRCENNGCCNPSLKVLTTCPLVNFEEVEGVTGCPSIRACPTCGSLVEHSQRFCKCIICPRCNVEFCFVCLKLARECLGTSNAYNLCGSGIAPRQTHIPEWKKN